jgi:hypothetical protein
MTSTTDSATIQSKQLEAVNACKRAMQLLQEATEANELEPVALALNQAQSAVAVLAHYRVEREKVEVSIPEKDDTAPLPSEPMELDSQINPAEEIAPFVQELPHVLDPAITSDVESESDEPEGPSARASLAQRLSESRIDSLQKALSINDRVRFASELVQGDMARFQNLCQTIDAAKNQAHAILAVEAKCHHVTDWEDEEEAPFQFLQLVRRVFA